MQPLIQHNCSFHEILINIFRRTFVIDTYRYIQVILLTLAESGVAPASSNVTDQG